MTTAMTPAQAEIILKQAFRIGTEDGSLSAFGSEREIEIARCMCIEALRRFESRGILLARMLASMQDLVQQYGCGTYVECPYCDEAKAVIAAANVALTEG